MAGRAVDMRTLKPVEHGPSLKERMLEQKLEAEAIAGLEAERKLKTKDGKVFIELIENALEKRIDAMVANDPESRTLMNMLGELGREVEIGRASAKRLAEMKMGRIVKELPNPSL